MRPEVLSLGVAVVFAALLVTAAIYDFVQRRIPNWAVAALLVLFVPAVLTGFSSASWLSCVGAFLIAFVGAGALYLLGWIGAGDAKLFSAAALFASLGNLLLLFTATALVGGLMAVGVLIVHPKRVMRGMTARGRAENPSRGIPYGVAIAAGAVITMYLTAPIAAPYR